MGLAHILSFALCGLEAMPVRVEAHVRPGLPGMTVVGLPDAAVREAKERVRSAATSSGFPLPSQRITLSLSPGDLRKEGPGFDLPLALAALSASGHIPQRNTGGVAAVGEVGLNGVVRGVRGTLAIAERAAAEEVGGLIVPVSTAPEACQVCGLRVWGVRTLAEAVFVLRESRNADFVETRTRRFARRAGRRAPDTADLGVDMSQVAGCRHAKRGLEVAAVGGHHVLMVGSPGSGKTMLAQRFPSIMPQLSLAESLEVTRIWSVCGLHRAGSSLMRTRPFRAPHHTASASALVGGGTYPRPGEITLAHRGVLFLDELPEFSRDSLEALRQPLEEGAVVITRRNATVRFPADFTLIAAMNPCPCGSFGHPQRDCTCTPGSIGAYQSRLSGPLLDRLDMVIGVPPLESGFLEAGAVEETSARIKTRVETGRAFRCRREGLAKVAGPGEVVHDGGGGPLPVTEKCNAESSLLAKADHWRLTSSARTLLSDFSARESPGGRGVSRAMLIARTIADLAESLEVGEDHLAEALVLRNREYTGTAQW